MDPVDGPLYARQSLEHDAAVSRQDAVPDRIDHRLKGPPRVAHQVNGSGRAATHTLQVCLAEVRNHVPTVRVDQGEDGLERRGELADGRAQGDDATVEGRAYLGEFEIQLRDRNLSEHLLTLRDECLHA